LTDSHFATFRSTDSATSSNRTDTAPALRGGASSNRAGTAPALRGGASSDCAKTATDRGLRVQPAPAEAAADAATFEALGLSQPLLRALRAEGYERPTPIQSRAVPHALAGSDLLACAQTGTGKTAAFVLPILERLAARPAARRGVRALVLSPTRELTAQIGRDFQRYGRHFDLRYAAVFGGVGIQPQARALRAGAEVLIATPGRLEDLLSQRMVALDGVEVLVLDEADRMLDHGFLPAIRRIVARLPRKRQTLFFSATMPRELEPLANAMLVKPVHVAVTPVASTPKRVQQSVYFVEQTDKRALLQQLITEHAVTRALVFTRTKRGADRVARQLVAGAVRAEAMHGNKSQNARERALESFREGKLQVLVATDLAARGIDVDDISHVINYDLPNDAEAYVHRIGRTARAGAQGQAFSFCSAQERDQLRRIERLIEQRVPVADRRNAPARRMD
jgi:ATP-dependent RNA helicase RhlE